MITTRSSRCRSSAPTTRSAPTACAAAPTSSGRSSTSRTSPLDPGTQRLARGSQYAVAILEGLPVVGAVRNLQPQVLQVRGEATVLRGGERDARGKLAELPVQERLPLRLQLAGRIGAQRAPRVRGFVTD